MNFKKNTTFYYTLLLLLTSYTQLSAQKVADSLKDVSYDYIWERYYADTTRASKIIYTDAIIARSKKEGDTATLMEGYDLKSRLYKKNNIEDYLKYLDSIITLGVLKPINQYPEKAFTKKASIYYRKNDLQKALKNFILANDYNKNESDNLTIAINQYLALVYFELGEKLDALKIFQKNESYLKKIKKENTLPYLITIFNISNVYNEKNKLDSASLYIDEGIVRSKLLNNQEFYYNFLTNKGINEYYRKKYKSSLTIINSTVDSLSDIQDKAHALFYLGKINLKLNNIDKSIENYKAVDSIISITGINDSFYRETYVDLVRFYSNRKDLKTELFYLNRLIKLDSINNKDRVYLNKNLYTDYEIPKLKAERDQIIQNIKGKNNRKSVWIFILVAVGITILLGFIYQYYKRKSYQSKFLALVHNQTDKKENLDLLKNIEPSSTLDISDDIVHHISKGLENFERDHEYLQTDLTLTYLAKRLQTNNKYLSKIISIKKEKTFIKYINDLRVQYAIYKIKNDTNFRKYTLLAIANEVGFKKTESFTKAFKRETGITPSYFIKELSK